jgi:phosphatidate cytidylyltransferase
LTSHRILTAIVLIPAVVGIIWWGTPALVTALAALVVLLALLEFFALGERVGLHGYRFWTCAVAIAMLIQQWEASQAERTALTRETVILHEPAGFTPSVQFLLVVFVIGAAFLAVFGRAPLSDILPDLSISSAALLFVAMPLSLGIRIDAASPRLLLFALAMIWVGDTFAYFTGRWFGRLKLAPQLSPNKTWEGAVANLLGSLIVAVLLARWVNIPKVHMVAMAALGNIAGQVGDLLESAYKRCAGAKDSGSLLPGHGGILDRIDALVLSLPVVWYYFQLVVLRQ